MVKGKKLGLVGRCLLGAGAVAGLAVGGCYEELARYQAVNAKDYKQATAINAFADMVGAEEKYQRDLDVAREGRSEVNVYSRIERNTEEAVIRPPLNTKEDKIQNIKKNFKIFTCHYWKDFNNNDKADYPEEFVGIKNRFRKDEGVELIVRINSPNITGKDFNLKIYNSKGQMVYNNFFTIDMDYSNLTYHDLINSFPLHKGELGVYKAVAYIDRNFLGSHEFEIIE